MKKSLLKTSLLATIGVSALFGSAAMAAYPERAVRVIVPFAAGGSTDIVARVVTSKMGEILGQTFVVENKGGAGGALGAIDASRAKPDGYTLSIATVSTMAVNPACKPTGLGYDAVKDFAPITNFTNVPNVIEVNPKFPAKDLKEFIAELKANPDKYSYGSSGTCGVQHLMGEAFKQTTDTHIVHVPYRGAGPAISDTVAGQIQIMFDNLPSSLPQIQAGKLRALAVTWPDRLKELPDVPTMAELGYPQLNNPVWYGLLAPANTPPEIINTLQKAAAQALADPKIQDSLAKQGAFPSGNTPEEFAKEISKELQLAKDIVEKGNLKLK